MAYVCFYFRQSGYFVLARGSCKFVRMATAASSPSDDEEQFSLGDVRGVPLPLSRAVVCDSLQAVVVR